MYLFWAGDWNYRTESKVLQIQPMNVINPMSPF